MRKLLEPACVHLGIPLGIVKVICLIEGGKAKFKKAFKCDLHVRCIRDYRPSGIDEAAWNARKPESDIYKLCSQCPDRKFAE